MPRASFESGREPEITLIRIGSGEASLACRLLELWHYRELLCFLAWRDVKVRYRQTLLGVAWAVLQPLLTMLLFTLFFGRLARVPSEGVPYALFAYAGLLPWTFFANAVTNSANSVVANPDLVTKVYVPRLLVPFAAILASLVDFGIGFALAIGLMAYYRVAPGVALAALPLLVILTAIFAAAVGTWMAALNVKYRDVRYALPFAVQTWLFASPVIYPSTLVPAQWRPLFMLNPLSGLIEGYRSCLLGRQFDWAALSASVALTLVAFLLATRSFRRMETGFADVI